MLAHRKSTYRTQVLSAVLAFGVVALDACAPIVRIHGQDWREFDVADIKIGEDNQETVSELLGSPAATGIADDSVWIYLSKRTETRIARSPRVLDQRVVAIGFDATGQVDWVAEYGLENRRLVPLVERETPTAGREFSLLQQLLGNVGRFEAAQ